MNANPFDIIERVEWDYFLKHCEKSFGNSNGCAGAEETLCVSLMDYVFNSGNYGNKWKSEGNRSKLITYSRTFRSALKLFQNIGVRNWKAVQKYRILRPFAGLYQAGQFL